MAEKSARQQFIVLPVSGIQATALPARNFFFGLENMRRTKTVSNLPEGLGPKVPMRVLDSIHEDGAKLVEISPEDAQSLKSSQPGLRVIPVVYYEPMVAPRFRIATGIKNRGLARRIRLTVISKTTRKGITGCHVVAFDDFEERTGAEGMTNNRGEVSLSFASRSNKIERLYIYPPLFGFWGAFRRNIVLRDGSQIGLEPVDLSFTDCLRLLYGNGVNATGGGVTVGVIDTGVDLNHPDLVVTGGENTVTGEDPQDFGDNGAGHGTHVAGIIAARGTPPGGLSGIAPAAALHSYRVFGKDSKGASNFSIAKAIDRAVANGCQLVNLSLGGGSVDLATQLAIQEARSRGVLCIAAAGNDARSPVSFPASDAAAIAVSALGRRGTFPKGSVEDGDIASPFGTDRKNFFAAFSNIGPEIDLIGPGVGVLSTVPGGHAPMSGTSMACPAVTGFAARLLSTQASILQMPPDQDRADAAEQALLQAAKSLGFGPKFEGKGLPS